MIGGHGLQQPSWGVSQLLVNGGRTCDAGCRDEVHLQHGADGVQHVHELIFPAG